MNLKVIKDLKYLQSIINSVTIKNYDDFKNLCITLGGHNLTKTYFDLNIGSICATLLFENNTLSLSNGIEIYNDEQECIKACLVDFNAENFGL